MSACPDTYPSKINWLSDILEPVEHILLLLFTFETPAKLFEGLDWHQHTFVRQEVEAINPVREIKQRERDCLYTDNQE